MTTIFMILDTLAHDFPSTSEPSPVGPGALSRSAMLLWRSWATRRSTWRRKSTSPWIWASLYFMWPTWNRIPSNPPRNENQEMIRPAREEGCNQLVEEGNLLYVSFCFCYFLLAQKNGHLRIMRLVTSRPSFLALLPPKKKTTAKPWPFRNRPRGQNPSEWQPWWFPQVPQGEAVAGCNRTTELP